MSFNSLKTEQVDVDARSEVIKADLLKQISEYGKTLEEMDSMVSNHVAQTTKFDSLQSVISTAELKISELEREIRSNIITKASITKMAEEVSSLEEKKTKVSEEVTLLMSKIRVLQEEIKSFDDYKELQKKLKIEEISKLESDIEKTRKLKESVIKQVESTINLIK